MYLAVMSRAVGLLEMVVYGSGSAGWIGRSISYIRYVIFFQFFWGVALYRRVKKFFAGALIVECWMKGESPHANW